MIRCIFLVIFIMGCFSVNAQEKNEFKKYDIFPAISYSPETQLTLGVIGFRYLNLAKEDTTRQSNIRFLAIYTTANQVAIESNWNIFTNGNKWWFRGDFGFIIFPDRNYGLGNDADALVYEYDLRKQQIRDTTINNFVRYTIRRLRFNARALRKISKSLYGGFSLETEYQWGHEFLGDSIEFFNGEEDIRALADNIEGMRSGLGWTMIWDSRDHLLNPRKGSYIEVINNFYGRYIGSDYEFISLNLDLRKYLTFAGNRTLAIRGVLHQRFLDSPVIPIQGMARLGGGEVMRGYFRGTFLDERAFVVQTELRIPFFKDENIGDNFRFIEHLGITAFSSAGQVYNKQDAFGLSRMNYTAGMGLRILLNKKSRVNLRVDYAIGLSPNSAGPDKRQSGFYFNLAEAF